MRSGMTVVLLIAVLCTVPSAAFTAENPQTSGQLITEAVQLYQTRHLAPANLHKSETILKTVLEKEPDNLRANYELSRVYFIIGDIKRLTNKTESMGYYKTGAEYGKKAIAINADDPWGHVWYAVNLGRIAQVKGVLNSLSSASEVKKEIATALKLDPNNTIALDVEAVVYYELPRLFGGDQQRSIDDLTRAITIDPSFSLPYIEMGRLYVKKGKYEKAKEYLEKALAITNPTYPADYFLIDRPHAEQLLKDIAAKIGPAK